MSDKRYLSKLLSWVKFNERVLSIATEEDVPLLEKLKFLAITATNLDEFFMVRIARLIEKLESNYNEIDEGGYTTLELYNLLSKMIHKVYQKQYATYEEVKIALAKNNFHIRTIEECSKEEIQYLERYFDNNIYPILTPMAVDQSRPLPLLLNKSLLLGIKLKKNNKNIFLSSHLLESEANLFALVRVPAIIDRFIYLPDQKNKNYIFIESIVKKYLYKLFKGHEILSVTAFRITKNADVELDENAPNFLEEMENYVNRRKWGFPVRLELEQEYDSEFMDFLTSQLNFQENSIYPIPGPIHLGDLFELFESKDTNEFKYNYKSSGKTELHSSNDIFADLRQKDYLLHRPYQDFNVVVKLIKEAANDPKVLAIKQTLYRVSGDSELVKGLAKAAQNGKQVTVLVELKARFDEKQNIEWAKKLEKAGCHVVYGFPHYKVHSKILLIIRKEDDGIQKYTHFSTGNYNDQTAKLYTDVDLLTSNYHMGQDASTLFNLLTGYNLSPNFKHIAIAPINLKETLLELIENEILNAKKGSTGHIVAKMNSLVDQSIIDQLYKASQAGVKIELIVRGMCCLNPGIENLSKNITVKSIVGKYLEHSRLFYFYNLGDEKIYLSSADWRPRNLYRRIEQMIPIYDSQLKSTIKKILFTNLEDNVNSWYEKNGGYYSKPTTKDSIINCQDIFYNQRKSPLDDKKSFFENIKKYFNSI